MRRRRSFTAGAAVLALGSSLVIGTTASAASSSPADRSGTTTRTVLLTGDLVRVTKGAGPARVAVQPRSREGIAGQLTTTRTGGRTYVIPGAAARYLGVLDRSLFEVDGSGSAPAPRPGDGVSVVLGVQAGAEPVVPGLTVTSRTASTWRGHFTEAGAREFGAALTRQWEVDAAAHRTSRTLFGGVTRIASPGTSAPVAQPRFPQQTLVVKVIGPDGQPPEFAEVDLVNVDDARKFTGFVPVENGEARVSVPAGTYSGLTTVATFGKRKLTLYFVPVEEVEVGGAQSTMVFDARRATARSTVSVPKPATPGDRSIDWDRTTAKGGFSSSSSFPGDTTVFVAPTAPATKGRLDWVTLWHLDGPAEAETPYSYDLSFHDVDQVSADQSHSVAAADLAEVDARYYADRNGRTGGIGRSAAYPKRGIYPGFSFGGQPVPIARTEYLYAPPDARWFSTYVLFLRSAEVDVEDGLREYRAGSTYAADWLRGPLGPGIAEPTPSDRVFQCGYCRTDTTMLIGLAPVHDSTPGHFGTYFTYRGQEGVSRFRLYRDGSLVEDKEGYTGDLVDVDPEAATYRAVVDTRLGSIGLATSTEATTEVTFVSSAGDGPLAPRPWYCSEERADACTTMPVLVSHVPLPTDLSSTMPLGSVPMDFTVDHGVGAADPAITDVEVELSYDGGATYTAMPVTQTAPHQYRTTLANPPEAKGKPVGFRLTATDAAGGRLVQTARAAYVAAKR